MKAYYEAIGEDPFKNIPETYHVQQENDTDWQKFIENLSNKGKGKSKPLWIIKPGENSNQGCGIDVVDSIE